MPDSAGNKYLSFVGDPATARSTLQASICNWGKWAMELTTLSTSIAAGTGQGTTGTFYYISSECTGEISRENPPQPCVFDRPCTALEFQAGCPSCNSLGMHPVSSSCCSSTSQSIDCPGYSLGPRNSAIPYTKLKNVCGAISQGSVLTASDITKFLRTSSITNIGKCFIIGWMSDSTVCKTSTTNLQFYFNFSPKLLSTSGSEKVYSNPIVSQLARRTVVGEATTYASLSDTSTTIGGFNSGSTISVGSECYGVGTSRCNTQRADTYRGMYIRFGCDYGSLSMFNSTNFPTLSDCQPCKDKTI